MLVLTRRPDQEIVLTLPDGRKVRIVTVRFDHGDRVRIGVDAPPDVKIMRAELEGVDTATPSE